MIYLKEFDSHASYEEKLNGVGVVDFKIPNVSYCKDANDVHFNPYNLIEFYVGDITGATPQTVKIYTDLNTSVDIEVSKGNKWYSYVLPKDKGLFMIEGNSVKKVVVKADISFKGDPPYPSVSIIPYYSTIEASFKGSNISKVNNMLGMFYRCSGLTSLDLSSWNTSNVTDMDYMFNNCTSLTSLDLSSFNTSNVTSMHYMFSGCESLTSLDLSGWDTSNVTDMDGMFSGCESLTSLDLSGWDTSNVTSMHYMFNSCTSLTSLDLSSFNTSNVTDMDYMFNSCTSLTSLDLSGWDTSKVNYTTDMFKGCSKLKTITMKGCLQPTIDKIKAQLTKDGISLNNVNFVTE